MESDTPRTNAEAWMPADRDECVVSAYFARELERELAAEGATTASLLRIIALIREAGGLAREDLDALPGAVKAMRQQRDEAVRALKEIAHQDYRGHPSTESQIAMNALAAMRKGEA